ncbi:glycoside hydrolase family 2 [Natrialbaceae archaeon GCM10025810]|uniref:glycoside hydrolase family 2 n=1 Tax=Halovalidus salilacus TaxID=3075124 RepID=UPI00361C54F8
MVEKWTGGVVDSASVTDDGDGGPSRAGDGPPPVDEWHPVAVPDGPGEFAGPDDPIAFRTTFDDPRADSDERVFLECAGAYDRATIWANGTRVAALDPHFVPKTIELEPEPTDNELIVVCEPTGSAGRDAGERKRRDDAGVTVPGRWWDANLQVRPATILRTLEVTPRVETDADGSIESAELDVHMEIDTARGVAGSVTLSMRPDGFSGGATMERLPVELDAGERATLSKTLEIRDPSPWWPRGYGPQRLYAVRAKLGDGALERRVGLRTVRLDEDGLAVNGRPVRARGFARYPGADPVDDVERAVEANATILRTRASAGRPEFYRACDEEGVLVWQELPTGGTDPEVDRGRELASAIASTYGHHPSFALVGVREVPVDPYENPIGSGFLSRLAFRYRAWRASFDRSSADAVAEALPDGVPAVPLVGPPGIGADATTLSLGWRYLTADDVEWLLERYPSLGTLVAGFGTPSLASDDVDPGAIPGVDAALLERRVDDAEDSRRYQTRVTKTVAEALRRRGAGVIVSTPLRDPTPGGGFGVLTDDGEEKPAYRALADAYAPVQAVLERYPSGSGSADVVLVNDTAVEREVTVGWRAGDVTEQTTVAVGPHETTHAGTVEIPSDATRVDLEVQIGSTSTFNRYEL